MEGRSPDGRTPLPVVEIGNGAYAFTSTLGGEHVLRLSAENAEPPAEVPSLSYDLFFSDDDAEPDPRASGFKRDAGERLKPGEVASVRLNVPEDADGLIFKADAKHRYAVTIDLSEDAAAAAAELQVFDGAGRELASGLAGDGALTLPEALEGRVHVVVDWGGMTDRDFADLEVHLASDQAAFVGDAERNHLIGNASDNRMEGRAGADTVKGRRGDDLLLGGVGDDSLIGGRGDDQLRGGADDDDLHAGRGADALVGGDGSDLLFGGRGRDRLDGGRGMDLLDGGARKDWLRGGAGCDLFRFSDGEDVVLDWGVGADAMDVSGLATRFKEISVSAERGGARVEVSGLTLHLRRVDPDEIAAASFYWGAGIDPA